MREIKGLIEMSAYNLTELNRSSALFDSLNSPEFLSSLIDNSRENETAQVSFEEDVFLAGTEIAGTVYIDDIRERFEALAVNEKINLFRESFNAYDNKAVVCRNQKGEKLGYIPRTYNLMLSRLMDAGFYLYATVRSLTSEDDRFFKIAIRVYMRADAGIHKTQNAVKKEEFEKNLTGNGLDLIAAGRHEYEDGNLEKAAVLLMEGLKKMPEPMVNIAESYISTENNAEEARYWAEKATMLGARRAEHVLSLVYYYGGYGIEKNTDLAFRYCKKAAKNDVADAIHNLGYMYLENMGSEEDRKDVVEELDTYFNNSAYWFLGMFFHKYYTTGQFTEKDEKKAFSYVERAIRNSGTYRCFYCKDEYYELCFLAAQYLLRHPEEDKKGIAFYYLETAADGDNAQAQLDLAMCLYTGYECNKSEEKARFWLIKAAEDGSDDAKRICKNEYIPEAADLAIVLNAMMCKQNL